MTQQKFVLRNHSTGEIVPHDTWYAKVEYSRLEEVTVMDDSFKWTDDSTGYDLIPVGYMPVEKVVKVIVEAGWDPHRANTLMSIKSTMYEALMSLAKQYGGE